MCGWWWSSRAAACSPRPRRGCPYLFSAGRSAASAPPAVLTLQGKVTADLAKIMRSPDLSDSDLIFSLFGAAESSSSSAFTSERPTSTCRSVCASGRTSTRAPHSR